MCMPPSLASIWTSLQSGHFPCRPRRRASSTAQTKWSVGAKNNRDAGNDDGGCSECRSVASSAIATTGSSPLVSRSVSEAVVILPRLLATESSSSFLHILLAGQWLSCSSLTTVFDCMLMVWDDFTDVVLWCSSPNSGFRSAVKRL